MSLKRVWEEVQVGPVTLKNRIAQAAHNSSTSTESLNDDFIAYHVARARGGLGLSILEAGSVHTNSVLAYLVDDKAIPGYERLMAAVRPYGMRVFQQLWHGGHIAPGLGGTMPWAASATPSPISGMVGLPMSQDNIDELVASFGAAARRCREAGLDGVEVHAGHGYLIAQFLSPLTNMREDGYNGSIFDRARILVEILRSIRQQAGSDFVCGVRLSSSGAQGGLSAQDVATVAAHLEAEGLIDYLNMSYGDYFSLPCVIAPMTRPSGYQLAANEPVAKSVKVPRLVTGRYRTLEEAEQVLRDDQADIVSMVRAQIADPRLVLKTSEGRPEDVRPCIACNQGCVAGTLVGKMQCTVNPTAGWERTLDETLIVKTATPKKVMIVGGGPAGLEAARVAALCGHNVILAEASPQLGGMIEVAKRAPYLLILGDLTEWLERQVYALGVDVRLSTYIDADDVRAEQPDILIVATGATEVGDGRQAQRPLEPPSGMDLPHVYDPASLIMTPLPSMEGKSAVIFDDTGRYDGVAAADMLARSGAFITYVTSERSFIPRLLGTHRDVEALSRLSQSGLRLLVNHSLVAIDPDHVSVRLGSAATPERVAADIVVVVTAQTPNRALADELHGEVPDIRLVGNALSPRDLLAAMHDGHRTARAI